MPSLSVLRQRMATGLSAGVRLARRPAVAIGADDSRENVAAGGHDLPDCQTGIALEVLRKTEQQRVGHRDGQDAFARA